MITALDKICIPPQLSIAESVRILNDGHRRIVLIIDSRRRLLGVLADSDIRRAMLKGVSFGLPVSQIMVRKPVVATSEMSDQAVVSLMKTTRCYEIPVVDQQGRVVGLRTLDSFVGQRQDAEVMIMAGGRGTRLRPLTHRLPKPLVPVNGRAMLFNLLDQLIMAGFGKITLALNYKAALIQQAIARVPEYAGIVRFVVEPRRLGTAGALGLMSPPPSPFLVLNADVLTSMDYASMLRFHRMERNHMTLAVVEERHLLSYGVVQLRGSRVIGVVEKPVHRYFCNAGIYVIDPCLIRHISPNRVFDMPDLINAAIAARNRVGSFPLHENWLDIGVRDQLLLARKAGNHRPQKD